MKGVPKSIEKVVSQVKRQDPEVTVPAIVSLPNCYVLTQLKYCHRNVAKFYGCGEEFYINGYPKEPQDLVIVSKTNRMLVHLPK